MKEFILQPVVRFESVTDFHGYLYQRTVYGPTEESIWFSQFRKERNIGLRKAAKIIGLPVSVLSRLEVGAVIFTHATSFENAKNALRSHIGVVWP